MDFQSPLRQHNTPCRLPLRLEEPSPDRVDAASTMMALFGVPSESEQRRIRKPSRKVSESEDRVIIKTPIIHDQPSLNETYNRKEKSLGLICDNFLQTYSGFTAHEFCLDDAASKLGVERRRIYDVVNVLESVHVVVRKGKNSYIWHGTSRLPVTLGILKLEALTEIEHEDAISSKENKCSNVSHFDNLLEEDNDLKKERKEKSLGILSQRFVQLFLTNVNDTITLDTAARLLLGGELEFTDPSQLKTKVRRLYDIANILSSLGLVIKTHVEGSRKPAFKWNYQITLPKEIGDLAKQAVSKTENELPDPSSEQPKDNVTQSKPSPASKRSFSELDTDDGGARHKVAHTSEISSSSRSMLQRRFQVKHGAAFGGSPVVGPCQPLNKHPLPPLGSITPKTLPGSTPTTPMTPVLATDRTLSFKFPVLGFNSPTTSTPGSHTKTGSFSTPASTGRGGKSPSFLTPTTSLLFKDLDLKTPVIEQAAQVCLEGVHENIDSLPDPNVVRRACQEQVNKFMSQYMQQWNQHQRIKNENIKTTEGTSSNEMT